MRFRYFLVTSVVCQKFVPKQCAVCRLEFFHLWFYFFNQMFLGFSLLFLTGWFSVPLVLFVFRYFCILYFMLSLFLASSIGFQYAPVSGCVGECLFVSVLVSGLCVTLGGDPFFRI